MRHEQRDYEFVVVGGGMAGVCAAVAAARRGLRVALLQDRPVLGGNGGKEIRIPLHGAEGGQNNRYFRETGLVEELRLENLYRNPLGNAELWDALLLEKVWTQENLDLYLNTTVTGVELDTPSSLRSVQAQTPSAERTWSFTAPLFADCTGVGLLAYLAGAELRTGQEAEDEYGESLAPPQAEKNTLGASLLFALRDVGRPVPFVRPNWAQYSTKDAVRFRQLGAPGSGVLYGWLDGGGELDPIPDGEAIRQELLKIAYGVIDHLKNGPEHAAALANYTLEWVGAIPGMRESRRILGDYVLTQQDLMENTAFPDAIALGGGCLEHHPSQGISAPGSAAYQLHLPGIYALPLRCLYSRNVGNLMLAGRTISATHVAFCSTRALVTGAQTGEAIGAAAFHCLFRQCLPAELVDEGIHALQQDLLKCDHPIPGHCNEDPKDLARNARVTESSSVETALEEPEGELPLDEPRALMLPLAGKLANILLHLRSTEPARVSYALHAPSLQGSFIPGDLLHEGEIELSRSEEGKREEGKWEEGKPEEGKWVEFPVPLDDAEPGFYWLLLRPAAGVWLATTSGRLVGVASYVHEPGWKPGLPPWRFHQEQQNPFSPWRKLPVNYCFRTDAWIPAFYGGDQVTNGFARPERTPNIWVSAPTDFTVPEWLELQWDHPRQIGAVYLYFNTDLDRDLPNLWHEHPERTIAECVRHYRLLAWTGADWKLLVEERENYHRFRVHHFPTVSAPRLRLEVAATHGDPRAQVYEVRIYGPEG